MSWRSSTWRAARFEIWGEEEEVRRAVGRGHLGRDLGDLVAGEDDLGHVHLVPPVLLALAVHAHLGWREGGGHGAGRVWSLGQVRDIEEVE